MFAPKAVRPSPVRTMCMKPSHMSGRSSIALPLAVRSLMRAMLSRRGGQVKAAGAASPSPPGRPGQGRRGGQVKAAG